MEDDPLQVGPESVKEEISGGDEIAFLITRLAIMFGGVLPFIPQYFEIHQSQNASGFSIYVCMVVVVSNVLRIAYWFGHWFDLSMLYQAVIMTIVMHVLLELILRVERKRAESEGRTIEDSHFLEFNFSKFWQWTTLTSYIQVTILLLSVSTLYATLFRDNDYFIEPLGFIALITEATLAVPQVMKNYQKQSTEGMNIYMIIFWTLGDLMKGYFFFRTMQPMPFRVCAVVQLFIDFLLFCQVAIYRNSRNTLKQD